jgi:putative transposase
MPTAKEWRKRGFSLGTFYKNKSRYTGIEVSEAASIKALDDEKAKLMRLLADTMLENVVLKDLLEKN